MKNNKVKFGIKFKDGYKVEVDAEYGNWLIPVAVFQETDEQRSSYCIWEGDAHNHLYGKLMTLVEAIIEEPTRREAIKNLVAKELSEFENWLQGKVSSAGSGDNDK